MSFLILEKVAQYQTRKAELSTIGKGNILTKNISGTDSVSVPHEAQKSFPYVLEHYTLFVLFMQVKFFVRTSQSNKKNTILFKKHISFERIISIYKVTESR